MSLRAILYEAHAALLKIIANGCLVRYSSIMPKKKYIVALTPEEREDLEQLVKKGRAPAYKINHARILLKADINQKNGGWQDLDISEALDISLSTIARVRRRLVEAGVESALARKPQKNHKPRSLDGEKEAHLIALACSESPAGQARWTLRLLADKMVELGYVEQVSHETIRQTLKKTN